MAYNDALRPLTRPQAIPNICAMAKTDTREDADNDLFRLEQRVDELISKCNQLGEENRSLKAQQEKLVAERAALIEKTELARSRVEAMITRLKALESGS